ncbi:hypothetical protein BKA64DRAFT_663281 [Cadophora sp. MPI-SDFR-AT-0126]|nr:hypothetical protein BKA64DRAFT_663281 [Leotiomycetes sp. MPI-SDFR-AT-0126]
MVPTSVLSTGPLGEISPQCSLFLAPIADTLLTPLVTNPQQHHLVCCCHLSSLPYKVPDTFIPTLPTHLIHPTHPSLPLPPCQTRAKRLMPVTCSVFRAFLHSATLVVYHLPPLTRQFEMIVLICFAAPCTVACLLALPYLNQLAPSSANG